MNDDYVVKKTIPSVLKAISESYNLQIITDHENHLACMLAAPIMFFGMIMNFITGYLVWHKDLSNVLINSIIFMVLGILFEFLLRTRINVDLAANFIAILYSIWFLFILFRLYHIVGPAVWMIGCIHIVFAMSRIKKSMAMIIGTVTFLSSIYVALNATAFHFELDYFYFIPQSTLLALLIFILSITHKINSDRYINLHNQYQLIYEQKGDITALYEEVTASEEELRDQNEQLVKYTEQIKKGEENLHNLAYYDVLTGLPNRMMFTECLDQLIKKSTQQSSIFYLVFIDVDSFKKVNDTMGHYVGDRFLLFAAANLKKSLHEGDLLGRIGGDEFAILITRDINVKEVIQEIEATRNNFYIPFQINSTDLRLSASFGISIFPNDGDNVSSLLKCADMSMNKAKEFGKNNIQFFNKYMLEEIVNKTKLENCLFNALANNEFYLVFQPQYYVSGDKIRGFEALTRWKSSELGFVSPMQFIPIAEETRYIIILGEWILRTACNKFREFQEKYDLDAIISVNISTIQMEDTNFIKMVKNILIETGLDPKFLELEITETVIIESFSHTIHLLNELKNMGIQIALDDFGVGYSSLNYIKVLPIDTLKIDKSFIDDVSKDNSMIQIVGDIISLGHTLGLSIIAEGVEHIHQQKYLVDNSCDYVQGYLFSKPLEEDDLQELLVEYKVNSHRTS